jgi:phage terminase large subunit-like protein
LGVPLSLSVREFIQLGLNEPQRLEEPEFLAATIEALESLEKNPLIGFEPHSEPQRNFVEARTPIVAAFAGNRFGKSTALAVCALREALDVEMLPSILRTTKRFSAPTAGWIVCPTEAKIFDAGGFQSVFEKWTPKAAFRGGSWGKAFNGARLTLSFVNGSSISFKTYQQDPSTLGGAGLHWVGFDEPPPRKHREECMMRLADYGGYEMFAMTPLEANTGYVRREIWKKRESPDITVVKGSIHDNPGLDKKTVARILGGHSDIWRRAREFGDFVDMGGLIYPEFERCIAGEPWDPEFIRTLDVVVGVDPGIRNAGLVWVGFDRNNVAYVFAASLLQDCTPKDYAAEIRRVNQRWGLRDVQYVADPAARSRGQTNAETVMSALAVEGVHANAGQNDVDAGIGQLRIRMAHKRFWVSPERTPGLLGLRDEADDYAAEEPSEGKDDSHLKPVKSNDHRLDALRYACMERFWDPMMEDRAPERLLGWVPGQAISAENFPTPRPETAPMGSMS